MQMSQDEPWAMKWKVEKKLTRGGQGTTRLVSSVDDPGRLAVLKILNNQGSMQARSRMRREAVALDTLAKEGIKVPAVLDGNTGDFGNPKVPLYFVMEYILGKTLTDEVTARKGLNLEQSVAVTLDLCQTVSAAHRENVLHRDLKPANVIVRDLDKPDLVIVDYGLSFNHGDEEGTVTQTGEQIRNELLALPETNALGGDRRDKRSDITALAAIMYYCLTGHLPGHLRDGRGLAPHRRTGFSVQEALAGDARCDQIEAVLDRAFSVELENRFQTCEELVDRLSAALLPPVTDEDPLAVAAEVGKVLRQGDRKTLLAEYSKHVQSLFHQFHSILNGIIAGLRPFNVGIGFSDFGDNVLPSGFDKLWHAIVINVTLNPHDLSRAIVLAIAARGSQCVLFRHINTKQSGHGPDIRAGDKWYELYWFQPEAMTTAELFRPFINQSLNQAMRSLRDDVMVR
jgi:serine/threonine-protein kinase